MHEARLLVLGVAQRFEHAVDMRRQAGTALDGEALRLVEDIDLVVFVEAHRHQRVGGAAARAERARDMRAAAGRIDAERWNPHHLARIDAVIGLGAAAIDAHLTRSQQLLQMPERQARIVFLEPAIEAHAGLVGPYSLGDDGRHEKSPSIEGASYHPASVLTSQSPANSARTDTISDTSA